MARATILVRIWNPSFGWCYRTGYPEGREDLAMLKARSFEKEGTPVQVHRRTPEGPQMIYESPKP